MQPRAEKVNRPRKYRGPTNYRIEGYQQHFRYGEQTGYTVNQPPHVVDGHLIVVARLGDGFGVFTEITDDSHVYKMLPKAGG